MEMETWSEKLFTTLFLRSLAFNLYNNVISREKKNEENKLYGEKKWKDLMT